MTGLRYSSGFVSTTLAGSLGAVTPGTAGPVVLASVAGLPAQYPFRLIVDYQAAGQEVIRVTQAATGTGPFTFANCIRGDDGSAAPLHNTGALVVHGVSAQDFSDRKVVTSVFTYGADPTGAADVTTPLKNAITAAAAAGGGEVWIPAGSYVASTGKIPLATGVKIRGDGYSATTITYTGSGVGHQYLFDGDPVGTTQTVHLEEAEISGLHIVASGGDIMGGTNFVRSNLFTDCWLECNSNGYGIWNTAAGGNVDAGGGTGVATTYTAECEFGPGLKEYDNRATPTVPMWNCDYRGPMACNDSRWNYRHGKVWAAIGGNTAMQWMRVYGSAAGTSGSRKNKIQDLVFEFPRAGALILANTTDWEVDLSSEDLAALSVGTNPMIWLTSVPTDSTTGCANIEIKYSRRGGNNWSAGSPPSPLDLKFDSVCKGIRVRKADQASGGGPISIDCGNATALSLTDINDGAVILNADPSVNPAIFETASWGGDVQPEDIGLVGWTYDPEGLTTTGTALATAGVVNLFKIPVRFPRLVGKVRFYLTAAGSGLTAAQCFAGLYSSSGTRLSTSADQSGAFAGSAGNLDVALSTANVTAPPPFVWAAILFNGTTGPSLGRIATGTANNVVNGTTGVSQARWGTILTGQTSLPSSITPGSIAKSGTQYWAGMVHA